MKLATYIKDGAQEIGTVRAERIVSLSRAAPGLAANMLELIARWDEIKDQVQHIAATATQSFALDQVQLLAPVPKPGKILAIGLNYADHIRETGAKAPAQQLWFSKAPGTAWGPYDPVQLPKVSSKVDYEVEMVAIIGRGGRHISRSDAPKAVFGFCVGNDVSARDWQLATSQWVLGKSFDSHGPFGPWITTTDEIDAHSLGIRCLVNGVLKQNSNTRHLLFNVWDQIEHLSQVMTLETGDLIYTGTPGGVGLATQSFLKPGDRVRCEIDQLGAIENVFEPEV
jgi:2-keto-4-pentenoate hydratase/2-oxohepta-3-ene-1,7-dioic acid hydratase in catechol pathway